MKIDVERDVMGGFDVADAQRAKKIHWKTLVLRMSGLDEVEEKCDARREIVGLNEFHEGSFVFGVALHHKNHFAGDDSIQSGCLPFVAVEQFSDREHSIESIESINSSNVVWTIGRRIGCYA